VVYPARTEGLAGWLAIWNPVSPLIVTARASLTAQPLDHFLAATIVTLLALTASLLGLLAFRLIMPHLIARMGG
jgi:ABC-type polysaccharide/polyol phosphate export permease